MSDETVYDDGEAYVEDDVALTDEDAEKLDRLQQAIDHVNSLPTPDQQLASIGLIEALGGEAV